MLCPGWFILVESVCQTYPRDELKIKIISIVLQIFHEAGMTNIAKKQFLLTGYLEYLISKDLNKVVRIITPSTVQDRGSQLSLEFDRPLQNVQKELEARNVIVSITVNRGSTQTIILYQQGMTPIAKNSIAISISILIKF